MECISRSIFGAISLIHYLYHFVIFNGMKIILKKEHLEELERILDTYLSAHSRANWDNEEARKIIINLIMSKFRKAIGIL